MTEQTRAARAAAQTEDAWDRLAALAFGGGDSTGGCSEHAHAYECTCASPSPSGEAADSDGDQHPDRFEHADTAAEIVD